MGQKISPTSFRLSVNQDWKSRWFSTRSYKDFLKEDSAIRRLLDMRLKHMSVDRVDIERSPDVLTIVVRSARPGLIIGRSGAGVEELRKEVGRLVRRRTAIRLEVQEVRHPELSAAIVAEGIAEQIEKRVPYRRIMRQAMTKIIANKDAKGAKVLLSGRLNGNTIARKEHVEQGSLPLQTLRADIDYKRATAYTTYGTVGIKVWIYKGMKYQ